MAHKKRKQDKKKGRKVVINNTDTQEDRLLDSLYQKRKEENRILEYSS